MPLSFYSLLVSVPSPRARESARGEAFLHIVWQSRLIRPSELFFTLCAHEVTFGDTRIFHPPVEAEPTRPPKGTAVWRAKKNPGAWRNTVCVPRPPGSWACSLSTTP